MQTLHCDHNELVNWNLSLGGLSAFQATSPTAFHSVRFFRELAAVLARDEIDAVL